MHALVAPSAAATHRPSLAGWLGALWGLAGVLLLLGFALYRLAPLAVEGLGTARGLLQWGFVAVFTAFMAYAEGFKGFQKAFSPRVAARARHLRDHPTAARVLLAPFFCMAYFAAPRRRRIAAYALTAGVIALVVLVQRLQQPWRGLVDTGVVVGLGWGFLATVLFGARALAADVFAHPPEIA